MLYPAELPAPDSETRRKLAALLRFLAATRFTLEPGRLGWGE
jgi:hypothetical protein